MIPSWSITWLIAGAAMGFAILLTCVDTLVDRFFDWIERCKRSKKG